MPVARLRSCGMVVVGKAVMHELGMGTTGNNPHHGYMFMFFSLAPTYIQFVVLLTACQFCFIFHSLRQKTLLKV